MKVKKKRAPEGREAAATSAEEERDVTRVEPERIDDEFAMLPADIAYHGRRYAQALRKHLLAKHERDKTYARLYIEIREKHAALRESAIKKKQPHERLTEGQIDALIEANEEWEEVKLACIEAEVERELASTTIDALRAKKDALVSIGANHRAEMEMTRGRDFKAARDVEASRSRSDDGD
jgi:hypothetical protein